MVTCLTAASERYLFGRVFLYPSSNIAVRANHPDIPKVALTLFIARLHLLKVFDGFFYLHDFLLCSRYTLNVANSAEYGR